MKKCLIFSLLLIVLLPCVWCQETAGRVSGTVRNQSGAIIAGADVVLTNTLTNVPVRQTIKTTSEGMYLFLTVPVGSYRNGRISRDGEVLGRLRCAGVADG